MACFKRFTSFLLLVFYCSVLSLVFSEDDFQCLQGLKASVADPSALSSWDFSNNTVGFICNFVGATCWNDRENRLIRFDLRDMSLGGDIPSALQYCYSLTTLDLSGNNLNGSIPSDICKWLPYLVSLDLSNNKLTGPIPDDLANCTYLNRLILLDNKLSGAIPNQLASLGRLKTFSAANNNLSGAIPAGLSSYNSSNFEGNNGLRGTPLGKCSGLNLNKKRLAIFIAAGVFGAVTAAALFLFGFGICLFFFPKCSSRRKKGYETGRDGDGSWADSLRAYKHVQVKLFQKPLRKVKLANLMAATNGFRF
ncbi:hypothetical protein Vadar_009073 [Vaccinium darrowii]|uniref:Uncharacterized protein n=1 Tax=Vaccinium darrowii TaxID=229202 RepID=A0ACB7XZ49_9ERIC|nr:hypothetical protein Vadar_009073 [Vaccinium darrowii]